MKLRFLTITLMVLLASGCGDSSKVPGSLFGPSPVTQPPVDPGDGDDGTLSLHVEEGGSVLTNPDVGTCTGRADCDFTVDRGTIVALTAIPDAGWVFDEWDSCPGPSGRLCIVTVDSLTNIKAEFDRAL